MTAAGVLWFTAAGVLVLAAPSWTEAGVIAVLAWVLWRGREAVRTGNK